MLEEEHYSMLPSSVHEQAYEVEILVGEYKGTVIEYGEVFINGKTKEISFDFDIIKSPIKALAKENQPNLQKQASLILQNIIGTLISKKAVMLKDMESGEVIEY
jgi:hypothetical protein